MTRNPARLVLALALGSSALVLSACGSNSQADTVKAGVAKGLMESLTKDNTPFTFDQAAADCTAGKIVDTIGATKVAQLGLDSGGDFSSHPLSEQDASTMANALVNCAPNDSVITYFVSKFDEGLAGRASDSAKTCMHQALGRAVWINLLTAQYDGQAAAAKATFTSEADAAVQKCGLK
jgi:hypothetical protein